jgi:FKBP-type peptidyl-prolyl cis-trans isomerase SlpA
MTSGARARLGDTVRVHVRIELEDGFVAEDTFGGEPVTAVLGQGDIHACLERCITGMRPGEEKRATLEPEEAFGLHTPEAVHTLPRSAFAAMDDIEVGQIIEFETPGGHRLPGAVRRLGTDTVVVDFNHPLAGHRLDVRLRLVEIVPSKAP